MNGPGRSRARPARAPGLRRWSWLLVAVALLGTAAEARPPRYRGPHPVPPAVGGGWCQLTVLHVHSYAPEHGALYAQTPEGLVFAGDPTPFGHRGPRYAFFGHHPSPADREVICYLGGPHYHGYAPSGEGWKVAGDLAYFVGALPATYERERAARGRAWELLYRTLRTERPRVTVAPPAEWKRERGSAPDAGAGQ